MQRNEQQEKFIQGIKTIRDYWLSLPDKTAEEIVDGVLFSTFVMFDGDIFAFACVIIGDLGIVSRAAENTIISLCVL